MSIPFYHAAVRRVVAAVGAMFDDISIERRDNGGTILQTLKVPLTYAPKQRFYQMSVAAEADGTAPVRIVYPRLAYEMTSMYYDSTRKLNTVNKMPYASVTPGSSNYTYSPVPYNITFSLYIGARNTDDALQIVEQICPFFTPHFNIPIYDLDGSNHKRDVLITLQSVDFSDEYASDNRQERIILWTMNFMVNAYIYGPSREALEIKRARIELLMGDADHSEAISEVVPFEAEKDEPHTINTEVTYK